MRETERGHRTRPGSTLPGHGTLAGGYSPLPASVSTIHGNVTAVVLARSSCGTKRGSNNLCILHNHTLTPAVPLRCSHAQHALGTQEVQPVQPRRRKHELPGRGPFLLLPAACPFGGTE